MYQALLCLYLQFSLHLFSIHFCVPFTKILSKFILTWAFLVSLTDWCLRYIWTHTEFSLVWLSCGILSKSRIKIITWCYQKEGWLEDWISRKVSCHPSHAHVCSKHCPHTKKGFFGAKKPGMTWDGLSFLWCSEHYRIGLYMESLWVGIQQKPWLPLRFHDCANLNIWFYFYSCIVKSFMTWSSFSSCIKPCILPTLHGYVKSRFNK